MRSAVQRHAAKTVDDVLAGLASGTEWIIEQIGVFGLICAGISCALLLHAATTMGR